MRRMDQSISILMRMLKNMMFDRLVRNEKGFVPKKLEELRSRHKNAIESTNLSFVPDGQDKYLVISTSKDEAHDYLVRIDSSNSCGCRLICESCGICLHQASCQCYDFLIKGNMCKHIHFVMNNQSSHCNADPIPSCSQDDRIQLLEQQKEREREMFLNSGTDSMRFFDETKRKITEEVLNIIESCHTIEELKAIHKFIVPMKPSLLSLRVNSDRNISEKVGSQGTSRNIEQQRRFSKPKKSRSKQIQSHQVV